MESFSGSNKDSNFIKGTKIMENFSDNNENGSSIFQGKIREQDFSAEQKLNELKAAIEELDRQDLLRSLECERQASSCVDEIPSQAELYTEGVDEGYFDYEKPLGDFWSFFESLFNLFEVNVDDPKIYQMLKEKKEKNLIAAIIKFLCDKLKELIKKIFKSNLDLSWDKRLDKEIKELKEKLNSGELSVEEFARVVERLQALTDLKFRLQLAVTGWIITIFAKMFGVELAAIVEASTEKEDKKAEKTSLKEEENKEVRKDVEIKVDEREKPKVPVFLFDVSPGFVRPIVLSKPELDLLPKPIKELMPKEVIKEEIREVKETKTKVEEEKKTKPEGPKVAVCPPKPAEKKPVASGIKFDSEGLEENIAFKERDTNTSVNGRGTTLVTNVQGNKLDNGKKNESASCAESRLNGNVNSVNKKEADNLCTELAKELANFKMGVWKGAENEGSVNNAQPPKGLTNDVKVEKYVEGQSVGKT
uniref:hypothetical protein n=1 Tax=Wolbachia pipientis TaxID=955 RepID=UPI0029058A49|nr:hypothetical protein [Wolbachia pipientis]